MACWGGWKSGKGNVMKKYRLKLNKTKAYKILCQYASHVSNVPRMRECIFSHMRRTYWIKYYDPVTYGIWKVTIQTCMGTTSIRFYNIDSGSDTIQAVDSQWLLDHGMLEEVA